MYKKQVSKKDGSENSGIPAPPKNCSVSGCDNETTVAIVSVLDNGRVRIGAFSRFGKYNNGILLLDPKYQFDYWITRCHECYMAELIKQNKQQIKSESDRSFVNSNAARLNR